MYCTIDFKTKRELKLAIMLGNKLTVYDPHAPVIGEVTKKNGQVLLFGPHNSEGEQWYMAAELKDGFIMELFE